MKAFDGTDNVSLRFRRYDSRDEQAVVYLHEWAMCDAGTNPADVPGTEDVRAIEQTYLESGGEFLVGLLPAEGGSGETGDARLETFDGRVVAMGGFLPSEVGHEDERTVPGAAELHRMRVVPSHQGNGYGKQLLSTLEERALEAGFDHLLATTAVRQRVALSFYPDAGYEEVDRSKLGEYELVHFEKRIDSAEVSAE